jgi:hypothetical protein
MTDESRDQREPTELSGALSRRNALALAGIFGLAFAGAGEFFAEPAHAAPGYQWPLSPIIMPDPLYDQEFGAPRPNGRKHLGADFNVNRAYLGLTIKAISDGTVIGGQWTQQPSGTQDYVYGNWLRVRQDDGNIALYAHMQGPPTVSQDARVARGDAIGKLGSTGTNVAHLHLELLTPSGNVDPVTYISARLGSTPPPPTIGTLGDKLIRIQAPNRGIALIGAGYYRSLANTEEVQASDPIIERHVSGNDRQFDLWRSLAVGGEAASDGA